MPKWTGARIAEHLPPFLCDGRLLLVSNREPYSHRWRRQARSECSRRSERRGVTSEILIKTSCRGLPYEPCLNYTLMC